MDWKLVNDRPIWLQLTEQLTERIVSNVYPVGSKLPSVRELASQAGVNPNTMQRALAELESSGLAEACRTAGRVVTSDPEVIERVRRQMAARCIEEYLGSMKKLGYDEEDAAKLIAGEEEKQ